MKRWDLIQVLLCFFLNVKSHVLFRVPFWDFQNLAYFFSNLTDLEVRETLFPRHWFSKPSNDLTIFISKLIWSNLGQFWRKLAFFFDDYTFLEARYRRGKMSLGRTYFLVIIVEKNIFKKETKLKVMLACLKKHRFD